MTTLNNKTTKTQPNFDQFKTWEWLDPHLWNVINKKEKKNQNKFDLWTLIIDDSWTTRKITLKRLNKLRESFRNLPKYKWCKMNIVCYNIT